MTGRLATETRRGHLGRLSAAAGLSLLLCSALASAAVAASGSPFTAAQERLVVSGNAPVEVSGLMPGDPALVRSIELRANGPVRYRLAVDCEGSQVLAGAMLATVEGPDGGILYRGPLALAAVGGRAIPSPQDLALTAGQAVAIRISAALPLGAGNETAGQELRFRVVVVSYPDS